MTLRYEIEAETNAVRVFYPDSDVASLYQPDYPNGTPWENAEAAEAWVKLYIASIEDEGAPFAPAGPGMDGELKPTPEQIADQNNG
jgi:hypothetical protein